MTLTGTAETPVQRYDRISNEFQRLRHIHPSERTDEHNARLHVLAGDLDAILSVPPAGYQLPKAVEDLLAHAKAHGWLSSARWTPPGWESEHYVTVQVGRALSEAEQEAYHQEAHYGDRWFYRLTWHSRDCGPGKVRRFGSGSSTTPENPAGGDAPSLKAIKALIAAHPAPAEA